MCQLGAGPRTLAHDTHRIVSYINQHTVLATLVCVNLAQGREPLLPGGSGDFGEIMSNDDDND